jgi:aspartate aminotransferase
MPKLCGGRGVPVYGEDGSFYPRLRDVEAKVGAHSRAVIINSPNNPTGVMYSEQFIAEIVEFCEKKGIYLITDDIYHKLVFDGKTPTPAYRFTRKDPESTRVIVVNGISKIYGMTGFRVGWTIASKKVVEIMTNVQAQTTSCTSLILQAGAEGALTGLQSIVESLRLTIQNNRDVTMQELQSFRGVTTTRPEGTFYCLPDFRAYTQNSEELSNLLLRKALVVTVPGIEFGMEGYLRLSYSGSVKEITEGVARIKWALDPESPNEIYIGDRKMVRDWL